MNKRTLFTKTTEEILLEKVNKCTTFFGKKKPNLKLQLKFPKTLQKWRDIPCSWTGILTITQKTIHSKGKQDFILANLILKFIFKINKQQYLRKCEESIGCSFMYCNESTEQIRILKVEFRKAENKINLEKQHFKSMGKDDLCNKCFPDYW